MESVTLLGHLACLLPLTGRGQLRAADKEQRGRAPAGLAISLARLGAGLGIRGDLTRGKADDTAICEMGMGRRGWWVTHLTQPTQPAPLQDREWQTSRLHESPS